MTLLLQTKYAIEDNPNNIGLTFNPKNRFLQVGRKRIFSVSSIKFTENCKKACVAVSLRFIHIMTALFIKVRVGSF